MPALGEAKCKQLECCFSLSADASGSTSVEAALAQAKVCATGPEVEGLFHLQIQDLLIAQLAVVDRAGSNSAAIRIGALLRV